MSLIKLGVKGGLVYLVANKIAESIDKHDQKKCAQEQQHSGKCSCNYIYSATPLYQSQWRRYQEIPFSQPPAYQAQTNVSGYCRQ
ncbi:hypothetical protein BOTCAL_0022g00530 [Botryotinia calthae]|uniref:Uncharacterized protein n=1 Tax=Botryotinia calthae TaxID=38488 RepID=A0A4Y8DER4_9HELO|nr:hypothetical protein BOTCAL_0022g00530 [Botryotinia calthae]